MRVIPSTSICIITLIALLLFSLFDFFLSFLFVNTFKDVTRYGLELFFRIILILFKPEILLEKYQLHIQYILGFFFFFLMKVLCKIYYIYLIYFLNKEYITLE